MIAALWEPLTAIGTLALALVTALLANSTRKLASEAGAETRANWQPVLVIGPDAERRITSPMLTLREGTLSIGVKNIGRGPALVIRAHLTLDNEQGDDSIRRGSAVSEVLAPGERLTFTWREFEPPLVPTEFGIHAWSPIEGQISYGDVGYARYATEFKIGFRSDDETTLIDQQFRPNSAFRLNRRSRLRRRLWLWRMRGKRLRAAHKRYPRVRL